MLLIDLPSLITRSMTDGSFFASSMIVLAFFTLSGEVPTIFAVCSAVDFGKG
jgi:hypothetical protein